MDRRISHCHNQAMEKEDPPTPIPDLTDYENRMIELYKKNVDREALRANLKLTVQERVDKFIAKMKAQEELNEGAEGMIDDQGSNLGNCANKKDHGH